MLVGKTSVTDKPTGIDWYVNSSMCVGNIIHEDILITVVSLTTPWNYRYILFAGRNIYESEEDGVC